MIPDTQTSSFMNDQEPLRGFAPLMRMALSGVDLTPLGTQLLARAATHPDDANTLMDLAIILQLLRNRELGLTMQAQALEMRQLYHLPAPGGKTGIRLLAIMSLGDFMANNPLDCLLEGSDIALDMLYVGANLPFPETLPDHDVVICAINESEQNDPLLIQLGAALKGWPRPVLNAPGQIAKLSRDEACTLFSSLPGVDMPISVRIDRETLERLGREELAMTAILGDGDFPVIVRPVDSHAGQGLARLDSAAAIADYLNTLPDKHEFYVARFVDYRGNDGLFRKYRIVLIEGRPFICHLGVSEHWMIHYLNAGMAESAEKRAEEARCMENFDQDFALRHQAAFRALNERMGLDYWGFDCGETAEGKLLIFEADVGMMVHAMDPVDLFPYKQPQMRKVFAAFRQMLLNAMQRGVS
jgi:glutathione synthase/RimK-type ligase-like ATP-grasp enzyme